MSCYRCGHEANQHDAGCTVEVYGGHYCGCPRSCFDVDADDEGRRKAQAYLRPYTICRGCQRLLSENTPMPSRSKGDDTSCVMVILDLCADCRAKQDGPVAIDYVAPPETCQHGVLETVNIGPWELSTCRHCGEEFSRLTG